MSNISHPVFISVLSLTPKWMTHGHILMTAFKQAGTISSVSKTSKWELKDLREAQVSESLFLWLQTSKSSTLSSPLSPQLLISPAALFKCFSTSRGHQDLPSQSSNLLKLLALKPPLSQKSLYCTSPFLHTSKIPPFFFAAPPQHPQFASLVTWL